MKFVQHVCDTSQFLQGPRQLIVLYLLPLWRMQNTPAEGPGHCSFFALFLLTLLSNHQSRMGFVSLSFCHRLVMYRVRGVIRRDLETTINAKYEPDPRWYNPPKIDLAEEIV